MSAQWRDDPVAFFKDELDNNGEVNYFFYRMELAAKKYKNIAIIEVKSDMDLYNAHELKEMVNKMLRMNIVKLIIDLEDVNYIDSSGIGALIQIHLLLKKKGYHLRITRVHGTVAKVIKLTKLIGFLPIVDTITDAIKQLNS